MAELRVPVTESRFYVGPATFDVEDWASLSTTGLRHLGTNDEDPMIMIGTNIWSGSVGLSVSVGDLAEVERIVPYEHREEAAHRVQAEAPFFAWSFDIDPEPVLPPLPVGEYRVILLSAGIVPERYEAVAAHDTDERYWLVFQPAT